MIELDIKIKSENDLDLKMLVEMMMESLKEANTKGHVDLMLTAEVNGSMIKIIRHKIEVFPIEVLRTR